LSPAAFLVESEILEKGKELSAQYNTTIEGFEVLPGDQTMVFPRDIAMIKVFRPPFQYSSTTGFGGAIAIYTKKGKYIDNNGAKFSFILKGYTAFDSVWR